MKKLISIGSATLGALLLAASCNSSSYETGEASTPSVAVYKFALSPDKNILANLDSVFFSIDLENKRIFNANPLPYGTETKKLVPVITIFDNVSVIELTSRKADGTDTTHNYLAHPNDSINFANGPVSMKVRSYDGLVECTYSITVNVSPRRTTSAAEQHLGTHRAEDCGLRRTPGVPHPCGIDIFDSAYRQPL